ncbi:hypothetical protein T484DRAFT_1775938 [Baffinella frigidus]|nr:hypothetical protein T484DRAFT_1775938 [Cryptophyta sp. CCMP2293]
MAYDTGSVPASVEHRVVARHRSIIGELPGCVAALFRCAIDCEPDVQAQASAALASVLRHNKDNLAQLCSLDDAILALMSLAATATHKAAPPANEAIANIADVRDGSVEAGLQLVTTAGVLDMLVEVMMREDNDGEDSIYDHEDNDRRNAAAEAARAFANATEALRVPGEGLLLDDEGAGDEKPFRAKGVPGLRGAILNVATEGSDVGKENAMRCLANVGGEDDAMSEKVCWHAGLLDAVIALCSTGTDTAKREGMRTIINVADVELEQCEAFLQV